MKYVFIFLTLAIGCNAQTKKPEQEVKKTNEESVCISWDVYKGKKNHGQKHCTGQAVIRKSKDGKIDTVAWSFGGGQLFIGDEYEKYKLLSERGKYIIDSLKEDGITQLDNMYLTYESRYMKPGKKSQSFYSILGMDIYIYEYSMWNSDKGSGYSLLKETKINQ